MSFFGILSILQRGSQSSRFAGRVSHEELAHRAAVPIGAAIRVKITERKREREREGGGSSE